MQIQTDTVQIIFEKGYEAQAQRIANKIANLSIFQDQPYRRNIRKLPIILQSKSSFSNAYVGLAPYRSEFYTTPPQDVFGLGAINWMDNLVIHEYRHAEQFSNFNIGFSKLASFFLGEQGQAVANAAAIPDWYDEGDAVFNETKFSKQGRGRLPLFNSGFLSLALSKKSYSYALLRNGSYRKYTPDHYQLGFLLVNYGIEKYGPDVWKKMVLDAAAYRPFIYPFQNSLKKNLGISFQKFVAEAIQYHQNQWLPKADDSSTLKNEKGYTLHNAPDQWLTPILKNNLVHYQYPYPLPNGGVLVLKSDQLHPPSFYKIDQNGTESKICTKAISLDDYYSFNGKEIIYSVYQPDTRWGNQEYQQLRRIDLLCGKERIVKKKTNYFSPDLSQDGKNILVVSLDQRGNSRVLLLDSLANPIDSFAKPGWVFSYPKFSKQGTVYYSCVRNDEGEMGIVKFEKGLTEMLVPFGNRVLGRLHVQGDTLLYTSSYQNRDAAWAYIDEEKFQKGPYLLAHYPTGIYQPILMRDGKLVGSVFTSDGYRLGSFIPNWQPTAQALLESDQAFRQQPRNGWDHQEATRQFAVTKYPKFSKFFSIHSYRPNYERPEYSIQFYSQNLLNNFSTTLATIYNENEQSTQIRYEGVYGGTYVQPFCNMGKTWHRSINLGKDSSIKWNEQVLNLGWQLPLNLTLGKYFRSLLIESQIQWSQAQALNGLAEKLGMGVNHQAWVSSLSYVQQMQKAKQQIFPSLGFKLFVQAKKSLNQLPSEQYLFSASIFLPGIFNNHSLVLSGAYQFRDTLKGYAFSNQFPMSRGYQALDYPRMAKWSIAYHLPIAYPEIGFAQMIYFSRIRGALFYDHSMMKSLRTGLRFPLNTLGLECYFDTRIWNQQALSFGFRYNHLLNLAASTPSQNRVWELILPINLLK